MNRSTKSSFVAAAAALSSLLMLACGADEAPAETSPRVVGVLYAGDFDSNFVNVLPVSEDGDILSNIGPWPVIRALVLGPIKLLVHPSGFLLVLTNLNTVSTYPIDKTTGQLDSDNAVQTALAHPPSDMVLSANGDRLYISNTDSTISVFDVGPDGALTETENSPFPTKEDLRRLAMDSTQMFGAHWDQDSSAVSVFTIGDHGDLSEVASSPFPIGSGIWSITVAGSLLLVPSYDDNNLLVFEIGAGTLKEAKGSPYATATGPRGPALSSRGFVYVPNYYHGTLGAFSMDIGTGALAPVPGQPFPTLHSPIEALVDPSGRMVFVATNRHEGSVVVFKAGEDGALTRTYDPNFKMGTRLAYWELISP